MNPTPLRTYLDECRALADAATPGPWRLVEDDCDGWEIYFSVKTWGHGRGGCGTKWNMLMPTHEAELRFVAASREAIPRLLEMVEVALRGLEGSCYCDDPAYRGVEPCDACECLEELSTLAGKGE